MHTFQIELPEGLNVYDALCNVRDNCDTFSGNTSRGRFSKSGVKGEYRISGDVATIILTDKPFIASWSMVEERIRSLLE